MKRIHLKKRKIKKNNINIILIIIILVFICVIYILNIFSNKSIPLFFKYSKIETKKLVTNIVNSSVNEKISNNTNFNNLFITSKENNSIKSIDFNSSEVNKLLVEVSNIVEKNLNDIENSNKIIFKIPSGIIFNNSLLYNVLPKIPVKLENIGSTMCKLETDIKPYGINNALIKVNIDVEVNIKILLPFTSDDEKITISTPIIMKVIEGNVPSYYYNDYLNTPVID